MSDTYTHGHHESVLRSHRWRTVGNSAAYLAPHLAPGQRLLDVGCGPGTITTELAARVAPGEVIGIDVSADVVALAAARGAELGSTATFAVGDVYALDAADGSFDVVHAHQVLQHLTDPVAALVEIRRVLAPGGLLAARDSDYGGLTWAPDDSRIARWRELIHEVIAANGAEAAAGRYLLGWAHAAGFTDVVATSSTWTFADPQSRAWWGGLWADRIEQPDSAFGAQAVAYGLSYAAELAEVAAGFRAWATHPDGVFIVPHGEILARR